MIIFNDNMIVSQQIGCVYVITCLLVQINLM